MPSLSIFRLWWFWSGAAMRNSHCLQVEISHVHAHTVTYYWHHEPNVIRFRCIVTVCQRITNFVGGFRGFRLLGSEFRINALDFDMQAGGFSIYRMSWVSWIRIFRRTDSLHKHVYVWQWKSLRSSSALRCLQWKSATLTLHRYLFTTWNAFSLNSISFQRICTVPVWYLHRVSKKRSTFGLP